MDSDGYVEHFHQNLTVLLERKVVFHNILSVEHFHQILTVLLDCEVIFLTVLLGYVIFFHNILNVNVETFPVDFHSLRCDTMAASDRCFCLCRSETANAVERGTRFTLFLHLHHVCKSGTFRMKTYLSRVDVF